MVTHILAATNKKSGDGSCDAHPFLVQDSDFLPLSLFSPDPYEAEAGLPGLAGGGSFTSHIQPCTLRTPPASARLSHQPIWNELLRFYSLSEMEILPSCVLAEFFCVWELDRCLTLIIPKCC